MNDERNKRLEIIRDRKIVIWIFLIALLIRFIYFYANIYSPYFQCPILDQVYIDDLGMDIASGKVIGDKVYFRAPFYPLVLGAVYSISIQDRFFTIRIFQHILGAILCVIMFLLTKNVFNRVSGIVAGILTMFYGPLIFYEGEILIEFFFLFLNALSLYLLILAVKKKSKFFFLLSGIALSLSIITRPNILLFVPVVFLWILFLRRTKIIQILFNAILFILPIILLVSIVTVRNYVVGKDFVLISSQGGINFYLGNNPNSDGMTPKTKKRYEWHGKYKDSVEEYAKRYLEEVKGEPLSPSQVSDYWYQKAVNYIKSQPFDWLKLMFKKSVLFWNNYEIKNVKNYYFCKRYSHLLKIVPFSFGVIATLGIFGLIINISRRPSYMSLLLILYIFVFMFSIILYFVCDRLRLPVIVGLIPFAGSGVDYFVNLDFKKMKTFILYIVILLTGGLFTFVDWYHIKSSDYSQEFWSVGNCYQKLKDYQNAIESYKTSIEYDKNFPETHLNLGNCYWAIGDFEKAKQSYEEVIRLDVNNARAFNNLGVYSEKKDDIEKALEYYKKSISLSPDYSRAKTNLGTLLLKLGQIDEGKNLLEESLKLDDSDADTYLGLAIYGYIIGDENISEKNLTLAVNKGGKNYEDLFLKETSKISQANKVDNDDN
jgi:tetratricopeptide (TPR) repeat protein